MELYTIKDIAEIVGKDKSNVYRYIKKNAIAHTATRGQTLVYSDTQKNAIVAGLKGDTNVTNAQRSHRSEKTTVIETPMAKILEERIADLKEQNTLLIEQLKQKDQEIHAKNEQINEAHKLIDQQQQLNLSTQKLLITQDNEESTAQKSDLDTNDGNQKQNVDITDEETPQKSFWKKIFG